MRSEATSDAPDSSKVEQDCISPSARSLSPPVEVGSPPVEVGLPPVEVGLPPVDPDDPC